MVALGEAADILSRMDSRQPLPALLLADERLLWSGQPDPQAIFTRSDIFLVPFSLMWCGFAIFWEVMALSSASPGFALWGIPFVAIGLYFVVGRFFYKSYVKAGTVYALTSRRMLVLRRGVSLDELSLASGRASLSVTQFAGRMNVRFGGSKPSIFSWRSLDDLYANTGMELLQRGGTGGIRFHDVTDVSGLTAALNEVRMLPIA